MYKHKKTFLTAALVLSILGLAAVGISLLVREEFIEAAAQYLRGIKAQT